MKRIIVIGGGFGGFNVSFMLEKIKDFQVILIDPSDHFTYIPLIHEVCTGNIPAKTVKIKFQRVLKRTLHIKSRVVEIVYTEKKVKLEYNRVLIYDYLIIATGSVPNTVIKGTKGLPTLNKLEDAIAIKKMLKKMLKLRSKSICVIGEGPTGTELIAEIASLSSKFNIKMELHHFLYFQNYFNKLFEDDRAFKRQMEKLGVHVHPSEPVQKVLKNKISTKRGEYVFDLIIICTGVKPNTIPTDTKFQNGYSINNYCVIEQYNNVYAIGDVSSFKMNNRMLPNLAQTAKSQADYVIKDIIRREKKNKRKRFKPRILTQFISVGKHYAVAHFLRWVSIKGFLAWVMKKTYYFYDIFRVDKKVSLLKIYLKSIIFSNKYFF